jgi:hypothetical protein
MELTWRQTRAAWIAALPEYADDRGEAITGEIATEIAALCNCLLQHDGIRVCVPFTESPPSCSWLCVEGQLISADGARRRKGRQSECHGNSARLWQKYPHKYRLVTGYGLSADDGMWRRHSWLLDKSERVIETTEARCLYYGVILLDDSAKHFAQSYAPISAVNL